MGCSIQPDPRDNWSITDLQVRRRRCRPRCEADASRCAQSVHVAYWQVRFESGQGTLQGTDWTHEFSFFFLFWCCHLCLRLAGERTLKCLALRGNVWERDERKRTSEGRILLLGFPGDTLSMDKPRRTPDPEPGNSLVRPLRPNCVDGAAKETYIIWWLSSAVLILTCGTILFLHPDVPGVYLL